MWMNRALCKKHISWREETEWIENVGVKTQNKQLTQKILIVENLKLIYLFF